jgi:MOSC domain-containing protein YiiM
MASPEMRVTAIQTRSAKGTVLQQRDSDVLLQGEGLQEDYHRGGDRQVSLISEAALEALKMLDGSGLCPEKYAANLTLQGVGIGELHPGDVLRIGEGRLEITEVGKPCHDECHWFQDQSRCPLAVSAAFARVIEGGRIKVGDSVMHVSR